MVSEIEKIKNSNDFDEIKQLYLSKGFPEIGASAMAGLPAEIRNRLLDNQFGATPVSAKLSDNSKSRIDRMTIEEINGNTWEVHSTSGKTYTVKYCGSGDGDPEYIALWECDCPSNQYRGICKHIAAVSDFVFAE